MAQARKRKGSSALLDEVHDQTLEKLAGRPVTLGADRGNPRLVLITKLSFDQWLGLAKLALSIGVKLSTSDRSALATAAEEESGDNIASLILSLLDKPSLLAVVALLTDLEPEWVEHNFSMAEFAELLDALDEQEDLRRIIAPFQRIAKRWQSSSAASTRS